MTRTRRSFARLLLVAAALAAATNCATRTPDRSEPPQVRPSAPSPNDEILPSMTEEGDRSFTDSDGRTYVLRKLPKIAERFAWVDADTIRYHPFAMYDVARHDEHFFFVKIYDAVRSPQSPDAAPPALRVEDPALGKTSRFQLESFDHGLPRESQWRENFDVADMNGDGRPDIIVTSPRDMPGPPAVFLHRGGGRWQRWAGASFPSLPFDYGAVAVADFNDDRVPDLVTGSHFRGLAVMTGAGAGVFRPMQDGLLLRRATAREGPVAFSARAVVPTDWNRDGRMDFAAISDGPRPGGAVQYGVTLYENQSGSWKPVRSPDPDRLFGDAIAAGDVDGDGAPDLVTASHTIGETRILRMGGSLTPRPLTTVLPRSIVRSVELHDFDGDGRDEILLGYSSAATNRWSVGIDIVAIRADGPIARRIWWEEGNHAVEGIAAGDLDGDRSTDVVALTADGRLLTFRGDGRGFVTADAQLDASAWRTGCAGSGVRLADVDGDGRDEIIATFAGERTLVSGVVSCATGGGIEVWKVRAPRR